MKTAMQQLIDKLSEFKKELSDKYDADPYVTKGVSIAIGEANKLLEEEKRQIVEAYEQGHYKPDFSEIGVSIVEEGEKYYNQTYNNENKQDTIQ